MAPRPWRHGLSSSRAPLAWSPRILGGLALLTSLLVGAPGRAETGATEPPTEVVQVGFGPGFFVRAADGDSELRIRLRLQLRFTWRDSEVAGGREQSSAFAIQRGRLRLQGHVLSPRLKYLFHVSFDRGDVALKDLFLDGEVHPQWLRVRAGQFKLPYSRQRLTSSSTQQLVERALTDGAFLAGRDIGVMLHNGVTRSAPVEWALGVFNGTGEGGRLSGTVRVDPATGEGEITGGGRSNVPSRVEPLIAARLGLSRGDVRGYEEADRAGGPLRGALAVSTVVELARSGAPARVRAEVDGILKARHLSVSGAVYVLADGAPGSDGLGEVEARRWGLHVQGGYVMGPRRRGELAGRYARVDVLDGGFSDEVTLGGSVFIFGHGLKCVVDASLLRNHDAGTRRQDARVRAQVQLDF